MKGGEQLFKLQAGHPNLLLGILTQDRMLLGKREKEHGRVPPFASGVEGIWLILEASLGGLSLEMFLLYSDCSWKPSEMFPSNEQ